MKQNPKIAEETFKRIPASEFEFSMLRCSIFVPILDISPAFILRKLPENWFSFFNGEPFTAPIPDGVPQELDVLRLALSSKSDEKRFRITRQRVDFELAPQNLSESKIKKDQFYSDANIFLNEFIDKFGIKVSRLAVNVHRFRKHQNPGLYLAQHFCREEWWEEAPMNRPEHFELSAHKKFVIYDNLKVNSWVRNKTGRITSSNEPIILVEQDINTLKDDESSYSFKTNELTSFYEKTRVELDHILKLYYPNKTLE